MKVSELIEHLKNLNPDMDITIETDSGNYDQIDIREYPEEFLHPGDEPFLYLRPKIE